MEQVTLSVADLISLRNLIDAACSRGTFKANEMTAVGEVYNKLHTFIEAAQQQLQSAAPAEPEQTSDEPEQPPQAEGEQNA